MSTALLNRRAFVQGAGLLVATFGLAPHALAQPAAPALPMSLRTQKALGGWIRVEHDGNVTVFTGKAELGQGILTALAQIAAEELDLPVARVRMVSADTTRSPNEGYTYGSQSIEQSGSAIRVAAAEARARLLTLASAQLAQPAASLMVEEGVIRAPDGRSVAYAQLASSAKDALAADIAGLAVPKRPSAHRVVGTSVPRIDLPAKLRGEPAFIQDMRLPGMLFGRSVRPRRQGAKLLQVDAERVRRMPGVVAVVREGSYLGVVARREEQAIAAREALVDAARWSDEGTALPDRSRLAAELRSWPAETSVVGEAGQSAPAPEGRRLEASYSRPYLSQAAIGPSCGVAWLQGDHMTVWSHTQGTYPLRGDIATALGLAKVDVVHVPGSGCYGHNGADDAAFEAALLARAVPGKPVKLQWMRDDEFTLSPIGPAMTTSASATLSPEGRIVDWQYDTWSNSHAMRPGQPGGVNLLAAWQMDKGFNPSPPLRIPQPYGDGDRNAVPVYALPRFRSVNHLLMATPVRNGSLRTLGAHLNIFANECFVDELAEAASIDPAAFRMNHLADPRARAVLEAATRRAGWVPGARGDGRRGRGLAFSRYKNIGAYAAIVAEVEVDRASGDVRVAKVVAAIDVGQIVNPDGLSNQIEGGIVQAVSWTLKEEVRFDRQEFQSRDWGSYPILTFPEVPAVEVVLIDRPEQPSLGGGEAASGPASAAVANAFAHATGRRIRDLPLSPDKVKAALAA